MKKSLKTIIVGLIVLTTACNNDSYFELKRANQYPWTSVSELEMAVREPYLLTMGNAWGSPVGALGLRGFAESDVAQYLPGITGASYFYEYYNRLWETTVLGNEKELELAFQYLYKISTATNAPLKLIQDAEDAGTDVFANMTETDRSTVKRYKGELLFMRAWCYWYLARTWAPPYDPSGDNSSKHFVLARTYVNGSNELKNGKLATVEEVYSAIVQDLKDAIDILPTAYVSDEADPRSRVNKYAAQALLAKVYFYMGKHDLALAQLNDVINSGMYDLKDAPIEAFNRISGEGVSNEVIWEIALNSTSTKFDRNPTIFSKCNYSANGGGRGKKWNMCAWTAFTMSYSILKQIGWINADLSEPAEATKDLRYQQTYIRLEGYQPNPYKSGTDEYYAFINKYESRYPALTYPMVYQDKHFRAPTSGRRSNKPMLRLADMLLMRSIILFNNGDKTGAAADLNVVRERAGLTDISANDITERAIENERIKEMSGEHADRLFWLIGLRKDIGIGDRDASKFQVIKAPYSNYYWQIPELEKQNNSAYQ